MNSSVAIICHKNKILLFHRDNSTKISYPDCWQLPGGIIEEGETPLKALKRELSEEVTFVPKNIDFLGKIKTNEGHSYIFLSFVNDRDSKKFKHRKGEGQEIGFFTLEEALNLKLTPNLKKAIVKFKNIIPFNLNNFPAFESSIVRKFISKHILPSFTQ